MSSNDLHGQDHSTVPGELAMRVKALEAKTAEHRDGNMSLGKLARFSMPRLCSLSYQP